MKVSKRKEKIRKIVEIMRQILTNVNKPLPTEKNGYDWHDFGLLYYDKENNLAFGVGTGTWEKKRVPIISFQYRDEQKRRCTQYVPLKKREAKSLINKLIKACNDT